MVVCILGAFRKRLKSPVELKTFLGVLDAQKRRAMRDDSEILHQAVEGRTKTNDGIISQPQLVCRILAKGTSNLPKPVPPE